MVEGAFGPQALAQVRGCREALQQLLPRVRDLPASRRESLVKLLSRMALADSRLDLFEFCLARLARTWQ